MIKLNNFLAEFCGIIIGDGCLYNKSNNYLIMISGHPINDREYYDQLIKEIKNISQNKIRLKLHQKSLRLILQDKKLYNFFVNDLSMEYNGKKTYNVYIPKLISRNNIYKKRCLRGIFDTDGSVFTSNKKGSPNYPCIEITTVSERLAKNIFNILNDMKFRVRIRKYKPKGGINCFRISLNGYNMIKKWYREIGSSNPTKRRKIELILGGKAI